jgi:hypothetical protein
VLLLQGGGQEALEAIRDQVAEQILHVRDADDERTVVVRTAQR